MKGRKKIVNLMLIIAILVLCTLLISTNKKYKSTTYEVQILNESIDKTNKLNDTLNKENQALKNEKLELEEEIKKLKEELAKYPKAIYDNSDITKLSNITYNQLYLALDGTHMQGIVRYIINAEEEYGVNALFLTGLIANETGYGSSRRYKEDNNVGGYEVYTPSSKGRSFSTKEESVYAVAKLLSEEYLSKDGKYHNGKSSYSINKLYCKSTSTGDAFDWHRVIDKIANELKEEINSNFK